MRPEISIVIPAWKESARLPGNLELVYEYLAGKNLLGTKSEIIIVLEESEDRPLTLREIEDVRRKHPDLSITPLENDGHYGKGYTVRRGVLASSGGLILMTDADLSTPIEELDKLLEHLRSTSCDCVIGRRVRELEQPAHRKLMGVVFKKLTKVIVGLPFYDTQCGFKLFTEKFGKDIFQDVTIPGFGFDIEMLALGLKRGYTIEEMDVRWYNDDRTTVNPVVDSMKMLKNLFETRKKIAASNEKR